MSVLYGRFPKTLSNPLALVLQKNNGGIFTFLTFSTDMSPMVGRLGFGNDRRTEVSYEGAVPFCTTASRHLAETECTPPWAAAHAQRLSPSAVCRAQLLWQNSKQRQATQTGVETRVDCTVSPPRQPSGRAYTREEAAPYSSTGRDVNHHAAHSARPRCWR